MTDLDSMLRRLRLVLAAAAALALLVVPSSALAKKHNNRGHDRNRDGIPDKWEKKFGISTSKKGQGKSDPDKDGLKNKSEWQARTNPKAADTNGNGVADANEDPDRDNVDNGNEQRERTRPRTGDSDGDGVRDGAEDADRDKLDNAGEDDAGTDPMNPDSDGDGVKDGNENAGEITAWDGTTLTIRLFGGSALTGIVDEDTYLGCSAGDDSSDDSVDDDPTWSGDPTEDELGSKVRARTDAGDDEDLGDEDLGDDDPGADDGSDDSDNSDDSGDLGDDSSGDDGSGDDADVCLGALKVGAKVSEASLYVSSDGSYFDTVELDD